MSQNSDDQQVQAQQPTPQQSENKIARAIRDSTGIFIVFLACVVDIVLATFVLSNNLELTGLVIFVDFAILALSLLFAIALRYM